MSPPPTFTTPPWSYPLCRRLSGGFTIISGPISRQGWWLESRIHGTPAQPRPPNIPITYPPPGHHVANLLLQWPKGSWRFGMRIPSNSSPPLSRLKPPPHSGVDSPIRQMDVHWQVVPTLEL